MALRKSSLADLKTLVPPTARTTTIEAAGHPQDDFEDQLAELHQLVESKLDLDLGDEVQYELARLLSLLEQAKRQVLPQIVAEAKVAVSALLREVPKLQLARTIRYRLEMELLRHNGLTTRYLVTATNGNPVAIVGLGVLITIIVALLYNLSVPREFMSIVHLGDGQAATVAMAAFLGGVVSILSRFREFSKLRDFDPIFLFSNGALKPYLGIIFGIFVYAFLKSEFVIVPGINESASEYVWYVVGFLSGFSERFTKDIISRSEGVLAGQGKA